MFGTFEYALRRGYAEDGARTMVINMLVVMEIFCLFNLRYLHRTSFRLAGAMGTPAVPLPCVNVPGTKEEESGTNPRTYRRRNSR